MNDTSTVSFIRAGDRTRINYGVAAIESGGKQHTLGMLHLIGSSPTAPKKRGPKAGSSSHVAIGHGYIVATALDEIMERLGQALAGGAHPRRI